MPNASGEHEHVNPDENKKAYSLALPPYHAVSEEYPTVRRQKSGRNGNTLTHFEDLLRHDVCTQQLIRVHVVGETPAEKCQSGTAQIMTITLTSSRYHT